MVHSLREMPGPKWGIILYFLKKEQIFLGHEYNECSYVYSCYILLVLVRFDSVRFGSMVWIVCEIGGRRAGSQCRREWGLRRDSTSGSFANLQRGVEIRENEQWKKDEPRWIMLNCWITCFFTEERTRFDLPSSQVAKSRSHTWYGINHKYKYSIYKYICIIIYCIVLNMHTDMILIWPNLPWCPMSPMSMFLNFQATPRAMAIRWSWVLPRCLTWTPKYAGKLLNDRLRKLRKLCWSLLSGCGWSSAVLWAMRPCGASRSCPTSDDHLCGWGEWDVEQICHRHCKVILKMILKMMPR